MASTIPSTPLLSAREINGELSIDSVTAASLLTQQLQACATSPHFSQLPLPAPIRYRVACTGGILVREAPGINAPCIGRTLLHNEVFVVCESLLGMDNRIYLRLANGGWVFDDSRFFPENPSVTKLPFRAPTSDLIQTTMSPIVTATRPCVEAPCGQTVLCATTPQCQTQVPPVVLSTIRNRSSQTPSLVVTLSYRVEIRRGLIIRAAPDMNAPMTGATLAYGEVFHVSDVIPISNQIIHLRLADGRGWVLDELVYGQNGRSVVMLRAMPVVDTDLVESYSSKCVSNSKLRLSRGVQGRQSKLNNSWTGQRKGTTCGRKRSTHMM